MKRFIILFFAGLFFQALISCYPQGAEKIEDLDLAMTNYSEGTDFSAFTTFSIPDTIVYVSRGRTTFIQSGFDEEIINLVVNNFTERGYTRIPTPEEGADDEDIPSFVVTIAAFSITNYVYYIDNWHTYWDWYWGWWGGSFNPYYPWSPVSGYSYRSGSVVVEMISTRERPASKANVVWTGIADGLLQGSGALLQTRIHTEINQCFNQSPYLRK